MPSDQAISYVENYKQRGKSGFLTEHKEDIFFMRSKRFSVVKILQFLKDTHGFSISRQGFYDWLGRHQVENGVDRWN